MCYQYNKLETNNSCIYKFLSRLKDNTVRKSVAFKTIVYYDNIRIYKQKTYVFH